MAVHVLSVLSSGSAPDAGGAWACGRPRKARLIASTRYRVMTDYEQGRACPGPPQAAVEMGPAAIPTWSAN